MGYLSTYTLEVDITHSGRLHMIWDVLRKNDEAAFALDLSEPRQRYGSLNRATWYRWADDIRALSAEWPGVLFTMHREGGSRDIWRTYFRDGKAQIVKARVIIDVFDPEALR